MKTRFQSGRSQRRLMLVLGLAMALALSLLAVFFSAGAVPKVSADYCDNHTCTPETVTWNGNGTNNGYCSSFEADGKLNPGPGQQGWLFILTSPYPTGPWVLTATFNPGGTKTVTVNPPNTGSVQFAVNSPAGAQLVSASAHFGIEEKHEVLTVSHCEGEAPPTRTPTATHTPVTPTHTPAATHTPVTPTDTPTATETPLGKVSTSTPTPLSQVSPAEVARALPGSGEAIGQKGSPANLAAIAIFSTLAGIVLLLSGLKLVSRRRSGG